MDLPQNVHQKGTRLSSDQKQITANTKLRIQQQFREQLGLIVDTPKQGTCII